MLSAGQGCVSLILSVVFLVDVCGLADVARSLGVCVCAEFQIYPGTIS